ncbi:unnamed protein product, partial [Cuscuta campestris]
LSRGSLGNSLPASK